VRHTCQEIHEHVQMRPCFCQTAEHPS
jgi:hypothetical protein